MSRSSIALMAVAILATPLGGQAPAQRAILKRGAEIRVYAASAVVAGWLVSLSPAEIVVAEEHWKIDTIPRSAVTLVQVRNGNRWTDLSPEWIPPACLPSEPLDSIEVGRGSRLRITTGSETVEGIATAWAEEDRLLLRVKDSLREIPIASGTRVAVFAGSYQHTQTGLALGFMLGALGGAVGTSALCESLATRRTSNNCGRSALGGAALGGVVLGVLGGVVGSFYSERWIDISPTRLWSALAVNPAARR